MPRQKKLFPDGDDDGIPSIDGLRYVPDYLTKRQEDWLVKTLDANDWDETLKRRVQHFGYGYNYSRGKHDLTEAEPFAEWTKRLARKLRSEGILDETPDQLIVNEYQPGQGISPHVDDQRLFGETIVSLSLLSPCAMDFIHQKTRKKVSMLLEPRSALVLQEEARHEWMHGISQRMSDEWNGEKIKRERRLSLTFRKANRD